MQCRSGLCRIPGHTSIHNHFNLISRYLIIIRNPCTVVCRQILPEDCERRKPREVSFCRVNANKHCVRSYSDGSVRFVIRRTKNLLRRSQSSSRGSGGMLPREKFGAKSCYFMHSGGKTEWFPVWSAYKNMQKVDKNIFLFAWADLRGRAEGFFRTTRIPLGTGLTSTI